MIDLDLEDLHEVKRILEFYAPGCKALVFGSRVKGTAKKNSDLAIIGDGPIPDGVLYKLKAGFSISDIPILVDVTDLNRVFESFRKIVLETGEPLE